MHPVQSSNAAALATLRGEDGFFFDYEQIIRLPRPRHEFYFIHGDIIRLFADSEDTNSEYCFFQTDVHSSHSSTARVHAHTHADETTYVHAGLFEFEVASQTIHLLPGDVLHIPRGVFHRYRNVGRGSGSLWAILSPGGLEAFFRNEACLSKGHGGVTEDRDLMQYGIAV
jgi:mannose-6-phosphate isomerase-like protein (cupin superfamily)